MSQPENQATPENPMEPREPLPTIWEAPDALWEKLFLPLLTELDPPSHMGRPRADQRRCLDGMIYRARTGCQWNHLPQEFGSDSTVHRTVCRWDSKGVFDRLWAVLIYHCEELQAVHWEWQAADGCLNKARFIGKKGAKANRARHRKTIQRQKDDSASDNSDSPEAGKPECKDQGEGVGPNPTDRGKLGVKQSLLVEERGGPLSICIAGANVNDHLLLAATLDAIVVERPQPTEQEPQHLCLDKGYDNEPSQTVLTERGYVAHIRRIGEEKKDEQGQKTHPARRWVVERSFSWLSRWRGLLVRWEKKPENYLAHLKMACALLWFRRAYQAGSRLLG